jgi:hypothetical protein
VNDDRCYHVPTSPGQTVCTCLDYTIWLRFVIQVQGGYIADLERRMQARVPQLIDPAAARLPKRIQRRRTKGWRMPEGAVYVGRPTRWGNPYAVGDRVTVQSDDGLTDDLEGPLGATPAMVAAAYRDLMWCRLAHYAHEHPEDAAYSDEWQQALVQLRGRNLVCWCPLDQPCHADVLLDLANRGGRS